MFVNGGILHSQMQCILKKYESKCFLCSGSKIYKIVLEPGLGQSSHETALTGKISAHQTDSVMKYLSEMHLHDRRERTVDTV